MYGLLTLVFLMPFTSAGVQDASAYEGRERSIWLEASKKLTGETGDAVDVVEKPAQATSSAQSRPVRGQPRVSTTRCAMVVCSETCRIVGSKNDQGNLIYRMQDDPTYQRMRGEVIFCNQAEAKAAGYQPTQQS